MSVDKSLREPGLLGAIVYGLIAYYIIAYIPAGHIAGLIAPFIAGIVAGSMSKTVKQSVIAGVITGLLAPLLLLGTRILLTGTQVLTVTRTGILWMLPALHVFTVILLATVGTAIIVRSGK
ncbi:MAG: hypothetical protein GSR82_00535 [Desulfurococcales archaeon]|nr:hypothetical protein [Desulfurococcales archaeon]